MSAPVPPIFAPHERVLCYHGPLLYEAKVRSYLRPALPKLNLSFRC